jgi:hypothetical protein
MSHVYDYATIWSRAERALQECNNLPRRYFHFDSRFREAWVSGMTEKKNHFDGKWTRRGERGDMGARSGAWPGDQLR